MVPQKNEFLKWDFFFDEKIFVNVKKDKFCVYIGNGNASKGTKNEIGESWFVLLHGGGTTSMSWAVCAKLLKKNCSLMAIDLRGHGDTQTKNPGDLSIDNLSRDVLNVIFEYFKKKKKKRIQCTIIGHSVGGAVAVHATKLFEEQYRKSSSSLSSSSCPIYIGGVIVVDLVEGSAIDSFDAMKREVDRRPKRFPSIQEAILYNLRISGLELESCEISTPSQLKRVSSSEKRVLFEWITPLEQSEKYWKGWYQGLSKKFLSLKCYKQLILAKMERLDTELTVAHMQGKFKLSVVYGTGHFLHEENPKKTVEAILDFGQRFSLI